MRDPVDGKDPLPLEKLRHSSLELEKEAPESLAKRPCEPPVKARTAATAYEVARETSMFVRRTRIAVHGRGGYAPGGVSPDAPLAQAASGAGGPAAIPPGEGTESLFGRDGGAGAPGGAEDGRAKDAAGWRLRARRLGKPGVGSRIRRGAYEPPDAGEGAFAPSGAHRPETVAGAIGGELAAEARFGAKRALLRSPRTVFYEGDKLGGLAVSESAGSPAEADAAVFSEVDSVTGQFDPVTLKGEASFLANEVLPAGRARGRLARWDGQAALARGKARRAGLKIAKIDAAAAGIPPETLHGKWMARKRARLVSKARKQRERSMRLLGAGKGARGALMRFKRVKAGVANALFGKKAALLAAGGGALLLCVLAVLPLLSTVLGGGGTAANGGTLGADVEAYLAYAQKYADDDSIGYSLATRYHNPNMDCSSYVWYCLVDSGAVELSGAPFTTYTMCGVLEAAGFEKIPFDGEASLRRGDILVNVRKHTEIYAGDGMNYGAHGDFDGKDGDSSGREVCLGPYWDDDWDCVMRPPDSPGRIEIPEEYGGGGYTVTCYDQFDGRWASGTAQAAVCALWHESGSRYDDGIAVIDGRYLVACTPKFGVVGDMVDFYLEDGTRIPCIVADQKRVTAAEDSNEWGHGQGRNVLEFEVHSSYYLRYGNPGSAMWMPEWGGKRVSSAANLGSIL